MIELLVVVSMIGLLVSIVFVAVSNARDGALYSRAQAEMQNIASLVAILENDTGYWPCGCIPGYPAQNPVEYYESTACGLMNKWAHSSGLDGLPTGVSPKGCPGWPDDLDETWQGPYYPPGTYGPHDTTGFDPWANPKDEWPCCVYVFVITKNNENWYNYYFSACSKPPRGLTVKKGFFIQSYGADGRPNTCDDVFYVISSF